MTQTQPPAGSPAAPGFFARHRASTALGLVLLCAGLYFGGRELLWGRDLQVTEDAYVEGNVVQVTPQTTGTVVAIAADNTDRVMAGQSLVRLNVLDAQLSQDRAEAQLGRAVRQVRGQFAAAAQMQATIDQRRADLSRAQADYERRAPLGKTGAISMEEIRHAEESLRAAQAALVAAQQQYAGSQALIDGMAIEAHPDVAVAAAQVREAYIAVHRAQLKAPVSGMVTKRAVQVGQRVTPGAALMSIVPLDQLWVTANLKESQLANLRVGQPVQLSADIYGGKLRYSGRVVGLDAGTGSAFALLPAQNATGNWIKTVQRVPVRIALDPGQLRDNPLRIGLSMRVEIDTRGHRGVSITQARSRQAQAYATAIFDDEDAGAQAQVRRIIARNLTPASAPRS
ncbi:EmrA/EmrK family multidrug efflux transporter periplasmic adaptor subunit [Caulobacter zeae]|uniref:EmrA/EmrK family multidrug efflux transporter periplasmic adaptor subunit n=2 Tax=Caulobacter TaxID=75 RepID=A0A2T9JEK6_9CAUL|nr:MULTISPECIES: efflux RND transporter periplasmic adaptor subunit [Caulobacter]PLR22651.1 EmrA/EmrK family multidrug efflux transporter periplasmic adaptor subunit [Caulobacter zeae]PVM82130.1 EmrA/EmrK family multidrug efflux transporter periplasmic adaptor subunit [Caulobacter endophyticus]